MPTLPTPSGSQVNPIGLESGLSQAQYAADFDAKFPGTNAGQGYTDYAEAHPSMSPMEAAEAFALLIAVNGVDRAVTIGVGDLARVAEATGPAAGAAAKAVQSDLPGITSIGGFLNLLTSRQFAVRLAEGAIGIALIIVALDKLLSSSSTAGQVVHKAAKAAFLA